jgi:hypothetical protein
VEAHDPGSAAGPTPEKPDIKPAAAEPRCQRKDGSPVDCVNQWGVWVSAHQCWAHRVEVEPDNPAWEGHTDGEVWMCALIDDTTPMTTFWVPPGGPASPLPDPGELAQQAMGLLSLETAEVHVAPAYPDPTIVGVENWLWLPEGQWRPLAKTVTAGGTAVTVTARPENVLWDMGPELRTCFDAGRTWRAGLGDEAVTRCGYTYRETSEDAPGGVFKVTARIRYQADWTCTGACTATSGTLGLVEGPVGSGTMEVLQRQTVVVG